MELGQAGRSSNIFQAGRQVKCWGRQAGQMLGQAGRHVMSCEAGRSDGGQGRGHLVC